MLIKKYPEIKEFDTVVVLGKIDYVEKCTNNHSLNCRYCDYNHNCQFVIKWKETDLATKAGLEGAEKNGGM